VKLFTDENHTAHRSLSMLHTVSFHGVPMPRGLAFAIWLTERHGGRVWIYSCDRRDRIINQHNRQFGTSLHGQQWLVDAHRRDPQHYAPANSPTTTSHCRRSDGSPAYTNSRGHVIPSGGLLPWYMVGVDLEDRDQDGRVGNDVNRFLAVAHRIGLIFAQPYRSGVEGHHVVLTHSPIPVLEHRRVIDKQRS